MRRSRDEREAQVVLASDTVERPRTPCGCSSGWCSGDVGANGCTTLAQTDLIAVRLRLGGGDRLPDYEHGWELESERRVTAGDAEFAQQQADRREAIPAIEDGLFSRALFVAAKPGLLLRGVVHADEP